MVQMPKIGDTLWIVHNDNPTEFKVEFLGPGKVAGYIEDGLVEKSVNDIYATEAEVINFLRNKQMIIICREVCKNTGKVLVYKLPGNAMDVPYMVLSLRSRYNPELEYFYAMDKEQEELEEMLAEMVDEDACVLLEESNILVRV